MRGQCRDSGASRAALLHPRGWVVAYTRVLQPCCCHLTWQGLPRLRAAALPLPCPSALVPTRDISPLSTWVSATETAGHEGPFWPLLLLLPALLSKGGGKRNFSEDQAFPRPLPSETSLVENFRVIPGSLGWREQRVICTADLASFYSAAVQCRANALWEGIRLMIFWWKVSHPLEMSSLVWPPCFVSDTLLYPKHVAQVALALLTALRSLFQF